MSKARFVLTNVAVLGLLAANPAFAAGETRAADVLPMIGVGVGSTLHTEVIEQHWACVEVNDETLQLSAKNVQVDLDGRVVVDALGNPFHCSPSADAEASSGDFPFEILLGVFGASGVAAAVAGGGGSDSPG